MRWKGGVGGMEKTPPRAPIGTPPAPGEASGPQAPGRQHAATRAGIVQCFRAFSGGRCFGEVGIGRPRGARGAQERR